MEIASTNKTYNLNFEWKAPTNLYPGVPMPPDYPKKYILYSRAIPYQDNYSRLATSAVEAVSVSLPKGPLYELYVTFVSTAGLESGPSNAVRHKYNWLYVPNSPVITRVIPNSYQNGVAGIAVDCRPVASGDFTLYHCTNINQGVWTPLQGITVKDKEPFHLFISNFTPGPDQNFFKIERNVQNAEDNGIFIGRWNTFHGAVSGVLSSYVTVKADYSVDPGVAIDLTNFPSGTLCFDYYGSVSGGFRDNRFSILFLSSDGVNWDNDVLLSEHNFAPLPVIQVGQADIPSGANKINIMLVGPGDIDVTLTNMYISDILRTLAADAPSGLAAVPAYPNIKLSWNSNTNDDLAGYKLFKNTEEGPFALLAVKSSSETSHVDLDVVTGTTYGYRISSFKLSGAESWQSPPVFANMLVPPIVMYPPSGFNAAVENQDINLSWQANTNNDLGGYMIYKSAAANPFFLFAVKQPHETNHVDRGIMPGETVAYKISSFSQSGSESAQSPLLGIIMPSVEQTNVFTYAGARVSGFYMQGFGPEKDAQVFLGDYNGKPGLYSNFRSQGADSKKAYPTINVGSYDLPGVINAITNGLCALVAGPLQQPALLMYAPGQLYAASLNTNISPAEVNMYKISAEISNAQTDQILGGTNIYGGNIQSDAYDIYLNEHGLYSVKNRGEMKVNHLSDN